MSFPQQNKFGTRSKSRFPKSFIVIGVFVLVVILLNKFTFGGVSQFLYSTGEPVWKSQASVVDILGNLFVGLKDKQDLLYENKTLKDKITQLKLASMGDEILRQENKELKSLLNRNTSRELIVASIMTRPNRTLYDTFIIDVGRRDGVTKGARVFGAGEVAVGSVENVYARTSLISLYSTPGRSTEVLLGNKEDGLVSAKAIGRGGGDFEIHIPRGIKVTEGSAVFSPEFDGGIVGVIRKIVALPSDSFQTILFNSPANIQSLRVVAIELK